MNSPTLALRTASVLFGLTALAHLVRILAAISIQIGSWPVGRRWSALAVVVLALLSTWMWRTASGTEKKPADAAAPSVPAPTA